VVPPVCSVLAGSSLCVVHVGNSPGPICYSSHPGLTVVTRRSGARADCCSGNKAHPVPASSCSLVFRSCEFLFAKETRVRSVGKEACTRTPQQGVSHTLGDRTLGIRRYRLLCAKHEHSAEPCLIASRNLSPCCCVVNPTKGAILHCTSLVVVSSCRRSLEMRCRASGGFVTSRANRK